MGNRQAYLQAALDKLASHPGCQLGLVSNIYETPAWGKTDQADFLNLACQVYTDLSAQDFLSVCQNIEQELTEYGLKNGDNGPLIWILFFGTRRRFKKRI